MQARSPITNPHTRRAIRAARCGLVVVWLGVWVCAAGATGHSGLDDPLVLPPGVTLPRVTLPIPDRAALLPVPAEHRAGQPAALAYPGLRMAGPGRVTHTVTADASPRGWAHALATVRVGGPHPWSPVQAYRVAPEGAPGFGGRAAALLGDQLVVFNESLVGQPDRVVASTQPTGYTLRLSDGHIVVEHAQRRWDFQSHGSYPRHGWRIARVQSVRFPSDTTHVHYQAGVISRVSLPNGQAIGYERDRRGRVRHINAPLGVELRIERDEAGYIRDVSRFRTSSGQHARTEHHTYERDAVGRITSCRDPNHVTHHVTYANDQNPQGRETWSTQISDPESKATRFTRWQLGRDRKSATRVSGAVTTGGSISEAINSGQGDSQNIAVVHYPPIEPKLAGSAAFWADAAHHRGAGRLGGRVAHWIANQPDTDTGADGNAASPAPEQVEQIKRDAAGRVTQVTVNEQTTRFYYNQRGALFHIRMAGQSRPHTIESDDWGRITRLVFPNQDYLAWTYLPTGEISEVERGIANAKDPADLFAATRYETSHTRYTYDPTGLLVASDDTRSGRTRFHYGAHGQLTRVVSGNGRASRYRIDPLGRVLEYIDAQGVRETYTYNPAHRLATHTAKAPRKPRVVRAYSDKGQLVQESIAGVGTTTYAYDQAGRQSRITHPGGADTLYFYDSLNRIVAVRGSHQPPINIAYDSAGQRTVTAAGSDAPPPPTAQDSAQLTGGHR